MLTKLRRQLTREAAERPPLPPHTGHLGSGNGPPTVIAVRTGSP